MIFDLISEYFWWFIIPLAGLVGYLFSFLTPAIKVVIKNIADHKSKEWLSEREETKNILTKIKELIHGLEKEFEDFDADKLNLDEPHYFHQKINNIDPILAELNRLNDSPEDSLPPNINEELTALISLFEEVKTCFPRLNSEKGSFESSYGEAWFTEIRKGPLKYNEFKNKAEEFKNSLEKEIDETEIL